MYYSVGHGDSGHHLRVARPTGPRAVPRPRGRPDAGRAVRHRPAPVPRRRRHLVPLLRPRRARRRARVGTQLAVDAADGHDGAWAPRPRPRAERRLAASTPGTAPCTAAVYDWHTLGGPDRPGARGRTTASTPAARGRGLRRRLGQRAHPARAVDRAQRGVPRGCSDRPRPRPRSRSQQRRHRVRRDGMLVYHAWNAALTARQLCIDPLTLDRRRPHHPRPHLAGPTPPPPEVFEVA